MDGTGGSSIGTELGLSVPEETTKERLAAEFRASLEAFIAALGWGVVAGEVSEKTRSTKQDAESQRDGD